MPTRSFRVHNNRILFICPECGTTHTIAVPADARRRSIRCPHCAVRTQCSLNRRQAPRESQAGRCIMVTELGMEMEIDLHDISIAGLGFDLPFNAHFTLDIHQKIQFKCPWSPSLLPTRYVVRSVNGRRVGAQRES